MSTHEKDKATAFIFTERELSIIGYALRELGARRREFYIDNNNLASKEESEFVFKLADKIARGVK